MPVKSTKKPSSAASKTVKKATSKAPATKVATKEKVVTETKKADVLNSITLIKLWFEGWKKAFTTKGRASRFELWIFMLINSVLASCIHLRCSYYLSPRFLRYAAAQNFSMETIDLYINLASICFYLVILIPLIPLVSMLIRRMHDLGKPAWKNYIEPWCYSCITTSALVLAISESSSINPWIVMFLQTLFVLSFYAIGYYTLKLLITTFFYRGELKDNAFGKVQYNTEEHERLALKLSCFYFLFVITLGTIYTFSAIVEFLSSL